MNIQAEWNGIQLDYDCPESKLYLYKRNINTLKPYIPDEWQLSIIALPTWCNSRSLISLIKEVDYSVIQVLSVDDPRDGQFGKYKKKCSWKLSI